MNKVLAIMFSFMLVVALTFTAGCPAQVEVPEEEIEVPEYVPEPVPVPESEPVIEYVPETVPESVPVPESEPVIEYVPETVPESEPEEPPVRRIIEGC